MCVCAAPIPRPPFTTSTAFQTLHAALVHTLDATFLPCSHGGRVKGSPHTALHHVFTHFGNGVQWVVRGRWPRCRDTVPVAALQAAAARHLAADPRGLALVDAALQVPVNHARKFGAICQPMEEGVPSAWGCCCCWEWLCLMHHLCASASCCYYGAAHCQRLFTAFEIVGSCKAPCSSSNISPVIKTIITITTVSNPVYAPAVNMLFHSVDRLVTDLSRKHRSGRFVHKAQLIRNHPALQVASEAVHVPIPAKVGLTMPGIKCLLSAFLEPMTHLSKYTPPHPTHRAQLGTPHLLWRPRPPPPRRWPPCRHAWRSMHPPMGLTWGPAMACRGTAASSMHGSWTSLWWGLRRTTMGSLHVRC